MCMQDLQINRQLTGSPHGFTANTSIGPNPYRVGIALMAGGFNESATLYSGTDATGIPVGIINTAVGVPSLYLSAREIGQYITGPFFVAGNGGSIYSLWETIPTAALSRLLDELPLPQAVRARRE